MAVSPFPPAPFVLAHRGGAGLELENSPSAFERVRQLGVRWIETDVRAAADGQCFIIHDATLDRTTFATGAVRDLGAPTLRGVRLRNGDPLLSLPEALKRWPDLAFNIDVKSDDAILPTLRAVAAANAWHRVCLASFNHQRLIRLRRLAGPRLATSQSPPEVAALLTGLSARSAAGAPAAVATQVPLRVAGREFVTARFVARAHERGLAVHVWTVNDPQEMSQLLALGVDGLVTDHPEWAARVVAQQARS